MFRRFAVLSTYESPLLGHLLEAMQQHGAAPAALILDSLELPARDVRRFEERTGGRLPRKPLHAFAAGVPVYFVESHKASATRALLDSLTLDFIANGGTPRILNLPILSSTDLGVINCHPGRLPEYRGCTCPEWAIVNDDPVCNTVHRMSEAIDEGPVLMIEAVTLPRPCTYQDMRVAVYLQGLDLLARASRGLQDGTLGPPDFSAQGPGAYHRPIGDDGLATVIRKLEQGFTASAPR